MATVETLSPSIPQASTSIGGVRTLKKTITEDYTLLTADSGYVIYVNSSSDVQITISATLPDGFYASFIQKNTGTFTLVAGLGATVEALFDVFESAGRGAQAYLTVDNTTGSAATAWCTGALT